MRASRALLLTLVALSHTVVSFADVLTVSDAIDTSRFMTAAPTFATITRSGEFLNAGASENLEIFVSPDRKRWAAMLIRGDLKRDGDWAEVLVGSLESLEASAHPQVVARFFTHALSDGAGGDSPTLARANRRPLRWLSDSHRLALLWADDSGRNQISVVDVTTGMVRQVTKHATSIVSFENHGEKFLYMAEHHIEEPSAALIDAAKRGSKQGVTIETRILSNVLAGRLDGVVIRHDFKWFLLDAVSGESRDISGLGLSRFDWPVATFSGDGRFAIVEGSPGSVPESWERYTSPYWSAMIRGARRELHDYVGHQLMQLYVVDVHQAKAWPLWDAPGKSGSRIAWSPDGRSVALSPTFVPVPSADEAGLAGYGTGIVEVESGRFRTVPVSPKSPLAAASLRWVEPAAIELRDGNERLAFRENMGEWRRVSPPRRTAMREAAVDVRVEQGLNEPPVLISTERRSGRRRVIYDPNPQLRDRFSLGRVAMIDWRDAEGRTWVGRLHYPVNWQAGRRYPLVIEANGYVRPGPEQRFSLYGNGVGPGLGPGVSIQAAQPLANRGIMVLSVERKSIADPAAKLSDAQTHAAGYEAAIDHLDHMGLIDRQRVGISGYSNTGYLVQYALVHSAFRYAAAITDDNYDGSYFQALMMGLPTQFSADNGAEPYGEGLKRWIERAPAFNVDKIRTPLRLQVTSPPPTSVLGAWEMFTRLRGLNKPVELFLIPEIERGSHGIQNPAQCLASQGGAVDWFDYWLNDKEDPDPSKADQYARWQRLRTSNESAAVSARE